jgi:hypothetical protein
MPPQALASIGTYGLAGSAFLLFWTAAHVAAAGVAGTGTRTVAAGCAAILATIVSAVSLSLAWRRAAPDRRQGFQIPVLASVIVLAVCVSALELAARVVARPHALGIRIGDTVLFPYDWDAVRSFNKGLLEKSRGPSSFYVESTELGWTIGPSRRSTRGTYQSSAEGLRSARQGDNLLYTNPTVRIALFGDSFAFSEEVPFEESLNVHLERLLGAGSQVLNFGVPGFGIDQAVLRFEQEAERWKPRVTILQFITDDIYRIGNSYLFNRPDWALPFVKPRFIIRDDGLWRIELPPPDNVYAAGSVFSLPHLDVDAFFDERLWREGLWSWSYLARFVISRAVGRSAPTRTGALSEERIAVALIERFVASARAAGSTPIVVYFPDHRNLDGVVSDTAGRVLADLAQRGVDVLDTSKCMRLAGGARELIVGGGPEVRRTGAGSVSDAGDSEPSAWVHYSDAGNARMAACLFPRVKQLLGAVEPSLISR